MEPRPWSYPAAAQTVWGQGTKGWFGWWDSPAIETLVQEWLDTPDEAGQIRKTREIGAMALNEAPSIPLGRFFVRTVYRRSISGLLQGPCPYPWNIWPA